LVRPVTPTCIWQRTVPFLFCQREAIETIIYLYEIKKFTDVIPLIQEYHEKFSGTLFASTIEFSEDLDGKRKVKRYFPEKDQEGEQELPEKELLRYAVKWQQVPVKPL